MKYVNMSQLKSYTLNNLSGDNIISEDEMNNIIDEVQKKL